MEISAWYTAAVFGSLSQCRQSAGAHSRSQNSRLRSRLVACNRHRVAADRARRDAAAAGQRCQSPRSTGLVVVPLACHSARLAPDLVREYHNTVARSRCLHRHAFRRDLRRGSKWVPTTPGAGRRSSHRTRPHDGARCLGAPARHSHSHPSSQRPALCRGTGAWVGCAVGDVLRVRPVPARPSRAWHDLLTGTPGGDGAHGRRRAWPVELMQGPAHFTGLEAEAS